jgi:hypothetical protein
MIINFTVWRKCAWVVNGYSSSHAMSCTSMNEAKNAIAFYYRLSSPFTGYLSLSRHLIFMITLFISIITFLTTVCHHHLSRTSACYYHLLALSLFISPPFYFHNYIIYFNYDFYLRCFLICCVIYHVLTVGVLNNLRVKWYIWKFPSTKRVFNWYFYPLMFRKTNKTTINKNKTKILIGIRPFDSRLYLDISRSFNCPQIFTYGRSDW